MVMAGANPTAVDCLPKGSWIMDERNQCHDANADTNSLKMLAGRVQGPWRAHIEGDK